MRLKRNLYLFILAFTLFSCTNEEIDDDYIAGNFSFCSEQIGDVSFNLFDSVDKSYTIDCNDKMPIKKENVFNVPNILHDIEDGSYNNWIIEDACSGKHISRYKDDSLGCVNYEYSYRCDYSAVLGNLLRSLIVSNPTRYYSSQFIEDIEKLENEIIEKNDIVNKYGLYYVNAYNIYQEINRQIQIYDINNRQNEDEMDLINDYFTKGEKSMSLEKHKLVMDLINQYDIKINLATTNYTYSYEEYLYEINSGLDIHGNITRELLNTKRIFLPTIYQKAADILGINTY